ncbi:hypothetical protein L1987_58524 [Smallanthus sonchifolius]|uniref:Uncharacterized protein n=1 Tax=Smallanthus sonchifolius TaxID=185202 RepID=A0ACB9DFV0_9ASTR|nr:hypothetical protein L1987_58524 [Smallanthus sonchifolius]
MQILRNAIVDIQQESHHLISSQNQIFEPQFEISRSSKGKRVLVVAENLWIAYHAFALDLVTYYPNKILLIGYWSS